MKIENKKKLVQTFKIIGFLLAVVAVNAALYFGTRPGGVPGATTTFRTYNASRIYSEKENTIDVVFAGHSGVYSGISPLEIYDTYGIASYDHSQPLMLPWETYKCLKDLIKAQSPKLIMLDVDQFFYDSPSWLLQSYAKRGVLAAFPFYESHLYWRNGFRKPPRDKLKGYVYKGWTQAYDGKTTFEPVDDVYEMHRPHKKYFGKIYEFCKEKGIELALFELPAKYMWSYSKHNCIKNLADEYGLKFLDMNENEIAETVGTDWNTDTCDGGDHLNYSGARKATKYMGEWLHANYGELLPDRRGTEGYENYDEDLAEYKAYINERVPDRFPEATEGAAQ